MIAGTLDKNFNCLKLEELKNDVVKVKMKKKDT